MTNFSRVLLSLIIIAAAFAACKTESVSPYMSNQKPVIFRVVFEPSNTAAARDSLGGGDTVAIVVNAGDEPENDPLIYNWSVSAGWIDSAAGHTAYWIADTTLGAVFVETYVSDRWHSGDPAVHKDTIFVLPRSSWNQPPVIRGFVLSEDTVKTNDTLTASCTADDPEGDSLAIEWRFRAGRFLGEGFEVQWVSPQDRGVYYLSAEVMDADTSSADSVRVTVIPDTVVRYQANFTTDQVSDRWGFVGLLAGYGTELGVYSITWDASRLAMSVIARSTYATYGFRMANRGFDDGTFYINARASSTQFGNVGFIPKFIDERNYLLVTINFFHGKYEVVSCVAGTKRELKSDWVQFEAEQYYRFFYQQSEGEAQIRLDNTMLWSGEVPGAFLGEVPLGVAVYGLEDSGPAYFDKLLVTYP